MSAIKERESVKLMMMMSSITSASSHDYDMSSSTFLVLSSSSCQDERKPSESSSTSSTKDDDVLSTVFTGSRCGSRDGNGQDVKDKEDSEEAVNNTTPYRGHSSSFFIEITVEYTVVVQAIV
jgi:hypothetical protein